jgi:hypothetical protein
MGAAAQAPEQLHPLVLDLRLGSVIKSIHESKKRPISYRKGRPMLRIDLIY